MAVKCKNCGGAHPTWDCTKPKIEKAKIDKIIDKAIEHVERGGKLMPHPRGAAGGSGKSNPPTKAIAKRVVEAKKAKVAVKAKKMSSTGANVTKAAQNGPAAVGRKKPAGVAKKAAQAVPKKRGRPATGSIFDKIAWQREYMRDYRKGIRRKEPAA